MYLVHYYTANVIKMIINKTYIFTVIYLQLPYMVKVLTKTHNVIGICPI